jgi:hypothetical protein
VGASEGGVDLDQTLTGGGDLGEGGGGDHGRTLAGGGAPARRRV